MDIKIVLSEHAKKRMREKAISVAQIKKTIKQGAITKQTKGYMARYTYLEVAYRTEGDYYIVKTVKEKGG